MAVSTLSLLFLLAIVRPQIPYPAPASLAVVYEDRLIEMAGNRFISANAYRALASRADAFSFAAAIRRDQLTLLDQAGGPRRQLEALVATEHLFRALRVTPVVGAGFAVAEREDETAPMVLSHRIWLQEFGGDSNAVGRVIPTSGGPRRIAGVTPPDFFFPLQGPADVFVLTPPRDTRGFEYALVRIENAVVAREVVRQVEIVHALDDRAQLLANAPRTGPGRKADPRPPRVVMSPYQREPLDSESRNLLVLIALCAAAVMVATLLNIAAAWAAQSHKRRPELAIRIALGATPARLLSAVMVEGGGLVAIGGGLGVLIGWSMFRAVQASIPMVLVARAELGFGIGMIVGFLGVVWLCLVALTYWTSFRQLGQKGLTATGSPKRLLSTQGRVVTWEVAVACGVVTAWSLTAVEFANVASENARIARGIIVTRLSGRGGEGEVAQLAPLIRRVSQEGVFGRSIAVGDHPLQKRWDAVQVEAVSSGTTVATYGWVNGVSADYLAAMRGTVSQGRMFSQDEEQTKQPVVVVGAETARRLFGDRPPAGERLRLTVDGQALLVTVVGVYEEVGPGRSEGDASARVELLLPWTIAPPGPRTLLLHGAWTSSTLQSLRREVGDQSAGAIDLHFTPAENIAATQSLVQRALIQFFSTFAGAGLVLMGVGVFALISLVVEYRRAEIGIRMALGATSVDVVRWSLALQGRRIVYGFVLGAGVVAIASIASVKLFRTSVDSPAVLILSLAILGLVCGLAAVLPAYRATRIPPLEAIRSS